MTLMKFFGICLLVPAMGCATDPLDEPADVAPPRAFSTSAAQSAGPGLDGPLTGAVHGEPFRGTFRIHAFEAREGGVVALARITQAAGALSDSDRAKLAEQELEIPISAGPRLLAQQASAPDGGAAPDAGVESCPVLLLTLNPLHIELLGLVVDLQRLELTVTARPGQDALLGDLLCEVAGLLDPDGLLGGPTPENLTRAADLLGDVIGALLSGVVGGLVDGLTNGARSSASSAPAPARDAGAPAPAAPAANPPAAPAAPAAAFRIPSLDGGIAIPSI